MTEREFSDSGLILVSTKDEDQVEGQVLAILAPFAISIIHIAKIQMRGRLIMGIHIGLDLAHAHAIADDLAAFSSVTGIDVAFDFEPEGSDQ
jgi:predicted amino acid-binding ACT domain protein